MKSIIIAATFVGAALAVPQGVTDKIPPAGAAPAGCSASYDGGFEITVADASSSKRDLSRRGVCGADGTLVMKLADGVTTDSKGRTGYIASNYQFQFDGPPQAGAIYTSGFSICDDNVLALGSNKTFYRCLSGNFYNLYNENWAPQCEPVSIIALPCGSADTVSQGADGQVVGTTVVQTTIITALSDGQPQVITTALPVTIYTTYPATSTAAAVSQISDGQVQAPPPTGTAPAAPGTTVVVPTETAPVYTGASTGAASTAASSGATTAPASSAPSAGTTAPAPTTSAPSQNAAGRVASGSAAALVFGLLATFLFA